MISNRALQPPGRKHTYFDSNGRLKDPDKYLDLDINKYYRDKAEQPTIHPKLQAHIDAGTDTPALHWYYEDMPEDQFLPTAGIIRDESPPRANMDAAKPKNAHARLASASGSGSGSGPGSGSEYVSDIEAGSVSISAAAARPPRTLIGQPVSTAYPTGLTEISDRDESSDLPEVKCPVEDPYTRCLLPPLKEENIPNHQFRFKQETFLGKPSVKIVVADHIRALLVDDWDFVTRQQQLVPLPAEHSVNSILNEYLEYERPQRQQGSAQADILEEVVAGLKLYFEKCLGRILLYR